MTNSSDASPGFDFECGGAMAWVALCGGGHARTTRVTLILAATLAIQTGAGQRATACRLWRAQAASRMTRTSSSSARTTTNASRARASRGGSATFVRPAGSSSSRSCAVRVR